MPTPAAQLLVTSVVPLSMRRTPYTCNLPIRFVTPSFGASAVVPGQLETTFRSAFSPRTWPRMRPTLPSNVPNCASTPSARRNVRFGWTSHVAPMWKNAELD